MPVAPWIGVGLLMRGPHESSFRLLAMASPNAKPHPRKTTPPPGAAPNASHGSGEMDSAPAQSVPDATETTDEGSGQNDVKMHAKTESIVV
jgi:hypothetical protein